MNASSPRIALVTGASRGLGRSEALHLARQGVHLIITYKDNAAQAQEVVREIEALGSRGVALPLDVADDLLANIHLKGTFFLTQKLLPLIRDGGRIVNTSSGLARFSLPGYAAYAVMKGGIEVLTRYLAKELGPRGISVNTIAPGAIETDFGGGAARDNAQVNAHISGLTAQGRVGLPDDVGGAVAALLAEGNHWVTGQRIEVSGGMML